MNETKDNQNPQSTSSREIKFRAWDTNHNKMVYPGDSHMPRRTNGGIVDYFEEECLMQYTGVKDKSGKEIYEGDILQYKENWNYGKVTYIDGCFKVVWQLADPVKESFIVAGYHEIIGNIYENPAML